MTLLQFRCRHCKFGNAINIETTTKSRMNDLWEWLQDHDGDGGDYKTLRIKTCSACKGSGKEQTEG